MAMLGLRDISIIATPPHDRLSVKTYISRFDETLIKNAIEQEVRRGGQVFFLHNRVEDIEQMAAFVKSLVPAVSVKVAHGQMREHQLEDVMLEFIEQKFSVLVCTTIIESGIDIPNVNTLIVNHAERFGLAQLYQIRGRVGRSSLQAYAYFLTPSEDTLSDDSKKRLEVLATHQELGAGFQIASHDLELRGAGNILGSEQSGKMAEVGLEMYTDMLEEAIAELRGLEVRSKVDTEIKLPVSALIASSYVASENQRLQIYKSLFAAETEDEIIRQKQDLLDRFGPMPDETARLFRVAQLKRLLKVMGAVSLGAGGTSFYELKFNKLKDDQVANLLSALSKHPEKYRLAPDSKLMIYGRVPRQPSSKDQDEILSTLIEHISALAQNLSSSTISGHV